MINYSLLKIIIINSIIKKINDKLPILIKYRNGEILESIPNITSENLVAECNK